MSGISAILHGDTKGGKSTAAYTIPAPRLLLDAEMAHRWLPGQKVFWDPITEAPPIPGQGRISSSDPTIYSIDWETCVVIVRSWQTFVRAYEWLNSGQHPFRSVMIDSITEIQVKIKEDVTGGNLEQKLGFDGWDALLVRMEVLCRNFRDLTEHPTHPLAAVVITAMTELKDGHWRPYIQGSGAKKLPYFFDVIGYVYRERVVDLNNPTIPPRTAHRVLTGFDPAIIAGERINGFLREEHKLPPILENLNFSHILAHAFPAEYADLAGEQASQPTG